LYALQSAGSKPIEGYSTFLFPVGRGPHKGSTMNRASEWLAHALAAFCHAAAALLAPRVESSQPPVLAPIRIRSSRSLPR